MKKINQRCISPAQMQMIINSRIYWREQAVWIKSLTDAECVNPNIANHIFSHAYNVPVMFASSLRLVFGGGVSEEYSRMLSQNIILIRELIEAQKNDTQAMIGIVNTLYSEADRRAAYLDSINPYWDEDQWRNLIYTYLFLTIEQGNALLEGNYARSIDLFDRLLVHSDLIGDYFASGIYSFIILTPIGPNQQRIREPSEQCITYEQMNVLYSIRLFWMDLIVWTRKYLIFGTSDPSYAESVYAKLRQVPMQYEGVLKTIFAPELVDELTALIYKQIDLYCALIVAQVNKDIEESNRIIQLLYQNVDKRVDLTGIMNPYMDKTLWRNIQYNYLSATINEITSYLSDEYERTIIIFQRLLDQTEMISREYTEALLKYILEFDRGAGQGHMV